MNFNHHDVIPSHEERQCLANAIQQAVREEHYNNGYRQCHIISASACIVLNALAPPSNIKGLKYRVKVGRPDMVFCAELHDFAFEDEDKPSVINHGCDRPYNEDDGLEDKFVEHAWIERDWELVDLRACPRISSNSTILSLAA